MDFACAEMEGQNVVVIVNYNLLHENSLLPLEMTQKELKDIYLGVKDSEKGVKLLPADQKDKKIFGEFLSQFIGMSATSYKSHWVKKLFALGVPVPKVIDGHIEVIKYVSENAGAIGYVWKSDIKGNEKGIRAVKISP
ncbi:MAG: hypothetical protein Q8P28_01785 [Deltaproteobacteria bacterium]|nr:hypothetical protein [Deltaproteobacteria bacterium]